MLILPLLVNMSWLLSTGDTNLVDPAESLRAASVMTAVLGHAPEPESTEDLAAIITMKVNVQHGPKSTASALELARMSKRYCAFHEAAGADRELNVFSIAHCDFFCFGFV